MSDHDRRRQRLVLSDGLGALQHEQIVPDDVELIEIKTARPIRPKN